ncbi:MAG: iron-sulfur cluster carrier protein ApbC [Gammaproteobacteria bacterium]|nr:iron-sulfur cluster carrier protein ApbC [Gammaproteobacteria bacterium]
MTETNKEAIEQILGTIIDPNADKDLVAAKEVKSIDVDGNKVAVHIQLGYPAQSFVDQFRNEIEQKIKALDGVQELSLTVDWDIVSHSVQKNLKPMREIKNVIAVASGKGGVGKSTTAVNLALALSAEGAKVGILDADIYGPSQPTMLGLKGQPDSKDGKTLEPMQKHNLQAMSIGFLIEEDTPMIWRGPMVTQALEQLLNNTNWVDLDYLIVDLPPGTGDVQLTLAQKIPVSGAIIVTTPQNIALLDARKGVKMFQKVDVPILGIIENMSIHICSKCGHEEHIFGSGGGEAMSKDYNVELLGALPLDINIREQTDSGTPTVLADAQGRSSQIYKEVARKAAARLAIQGKDYSAKFPKIVIKND